MRVLLRPGSPAARSALPDASATIRWAHKKSPAEIGGAGVFFNNGNRLPRLPSLPPPTSEAEAGAKPSKDDVGGGFRNNLRFRHSKAISSWIVKIRSLKDPRINGGTVFPLRKPKCVSAWRRDVPGYRIVIRRCLVHLRLAPSIPSRRSKVSVDTLR